MYHVEVFNNRMETLAFLELPQLHIGKKFEVGSDEFEIETLKGGTGKISGRLVMNGEKNTVGFVAERG
ncbi:hypothetical protein [Vibrio rotiferianus]|uniref:hypothetical protein n=1 Tax=Vibrio rotiferianus TaxID=190895 RepID=UPI00023771E5|nr:hypothetical protein [Vibrio rotiferianus]